ncbi:MAG: hydantoinase/oxoprolinase N-terminal domain-containing protein, partial [Candidatus Korarchaeota archaeon]
MSKEPIIISIDAGGTMTDCFVVSADGSFKLGKALTNREDEARSVSESVKDALMSEEVDLSTLKVFVYAGTALINAVLTRTGVKTGLLITKVFEHALYFMRGH